jgi:ribosomal protein L35
VPSASFTAFHSRDITPLKVQTKIKPKKSAVKRFKVTSNGKLLHSHSGKQHLAVKKSGELLGRQQHRPVIQIIPLISNSLQPLKPVTACLQVVI